MSSNLALRSMARNYETALAEIGVLGAFVASKLGV